MYRSSRHTWQIVYSLKALSVVFFLSCAWIPAQLSAGVDFRGKAISVGTEIITNPGGFFYDIHQMAESVVPTRVGKHGVITTQIFPTLLPFTMANIAGRYNLLSEHPGIPQVEIFGGYSKVMALDFVDSDSTEGAIVGHHYGLSMLQSIHPLARVQFAYEVSTLDFSIKFKKDPIDFYGTSLSEVKVAIQESFVFTGCELYRGEGKYLFTQMGFGLESSKILARVMFTGPRWETGFTVYPEGPLVIYPSVGLRFGL
ncbi:MAG: hypothetical protein AABZ44_05945 [Elusimicrobiota bacterium]